MYVTARMSVAPRQEDAEGLRLDAQATAAVCFQGPCEAAVGLAQSVPWRVHEALPVVVCVGGQRRRIFKAGERRGVLVVPGIGHLGQGLSLVFPLFWRSGDGTGAGDGQGEASMSTRWRAD